MAAGFRAFLPAVCGLLLAIARAHGAMDGETLLEHRNCTACHAASEKQAAWILPQAAPKLNDIGNRVSADWLRHFLSAPHEAMPGATMPDVLRGNAESAEALTHYLVSPGQA